MVRLCAGIPGPLPARIDAARQLGLWGLSVDAPADLDEAEAARTAHLCREAGLRVAEVVCPHALRTDPDARAETVRHTSAVLRWAAAAGALAVRVSARAGDRADAASAALAGLADCCRDIVAAVRADRRCRLLVLTEVGGPVGTLLGASEAVRRVGFAAFGVALDPVGLLSIDTYFDNGSFLTRAVQQLGAAIGLVRARDALMSTRSFSSEITPCRLGEGGIDLPALMTALRAQAGDVPVCVVAEDAEALARDCARLRAIAPA